MCSTPDVPKVQDIPIRQMVLMPDGGDPSVIASKRRASRLGPSAMIFAGRQGLSAPSVSGPRSVTGL
jgi:hypothetical protein